MLANVESKKIESQFSIYRLKSMSQACLRGFEFKTNWFEPLADKLFALLNHLQIAMHNHKVISVANEVHFEPCSYHRSGFPDVFPLYGESFGDGIFQAMKGDVGQQG